MDSLDSTKILYTYAENIHLRHYTGYAIFTIINNQTVHIPEYQII